jgi:hypothetical protein
VNGGLGLLPLTVPEVRRLLVALVWTAPVQIRPAPGAHTTSEANASAAGVLTDRLGGNERAIEPADRRRMRRSDLWTR